MAGEKILIADDNAETSAAIRAALEGHGYVFVDAANGDEALSQALSEQPDIMMLELTMPGLDGFAVLESMSGRPEVANTKVLILTDTGDSGDLQYAYTLGAIGYIVKPFTAESLLYAVDGALEHPQQTPW